ncbi:cytochrome P450 family protein [Ceratobasidium sp. AG-Ba]|nr:cytochrome P450 family protein [Ceratobasidium sp. AG-Ba]
MLSLTSPPVVLVSAGLCALAVRLVVWRIRRSRLPPSPPAHPVFGHMGLLKSPTLHLTAAEWTKTHGDMVTLHFMDKNIVVLNSAEAAIELLEKRAASTGGRPREVMMGEVMGYNTSVGLHQPDERFRKLRRVMASAMHATAVRGYQAIEVENITYLLRRIAGLGGDALTKSDPDSKVSAGDVKVSDPRAIGQAMSSVQPMGLVREAATRFILRVAYGYDVKPHDPLTGLIHAAMMKVREGRYPLVEAFPWLTKLPTWFPGTRFLQVGAEGYALRNAYAGTPFERVKAEMRTNAARPSFVSNLLRAKGGPDGASEHDQDLIKWTAAALFVGGGDTTVAVINTFMLMMAANPEVQRIAQAEIANAIGTTATNKDSESVPTAPSVQGSVPVPSRLPGFEDRLRLPYLEAVFKEVMRFNPPLSMGLPHAFTETETYRGYVFPPGTIVRANIWAILHDPTLYPSPHSFSPQRHLGPTPAPNPLRYVFGYGRRICPGVHLAADQPWLAMAAILSTFDIVPGKGTQEAVNARPWDMFEFNGMTSQPKPLGFSLVLRPGAAELL